MLKPSFIFATGIENSTPTRAHGQVRVDEMEKCGHYKHWRTDFRLAAELGIRFLRYGPPLYKTFVGPGQYDWTLADDAFNELRTINMVPIVDLCHFGVPDWPKAPMVRRPGTGYGKNGRMCCAVAPRAGSPGPPRRPVASSGACLPIIPDCADACTMVP